MRTLLASLSLVVVVALFAVAVRPGATAHAQANVLDPLGCFIAASESGLDQSTAKQLCIGAPGEITARCFADAVALGSFTQYQAVQLCYGASSDDPVRCSAQVRASSGLPAADIVSYCAAVHWPFVSPPSAGSPDCLVAAQDLGIVDAQATRVCRGSTSTAPADCVGRGQELLVGLTDTDLVDLCAAVVPWPCASYDCGPAVSGYGPG